MAEPVRRKADWTPVLTNQRRTEASPVTAQELELIMSAAERLWIAAGEEARHGQNMAIAAYSTLAGLITVVAGVIAILQSAGDISYSIFPAIVLVAVILSPLAVFWVRRLTRPDPPAKRAAAIELAALVGEVYLDVAEREGWSFAYRQALETRLSVFSLRSERSSTDARTSRRSDPFPPRPSRPKVED